MSKPIFKDQHEFEKLFKEYFNPLCNYVYNYLNNWENSREVIQSTFLKIWENRNHITVNTSAKAYLYRAAKNAMIDFIRKESKIKDHLSNISEKSIAAEFPNGFELQPFVIRQAILKAMETLKPKNRKIFELHKFEGLTYKEIASFLNISERSVEDNVARALKLLRDELIDKISIHD